MNNKDFRQLISDTPLRSTDASNIGATPRATPMLGSRGRSSIPMTPRSVRGSSGTDFARQLAERDAGAQTQRKFRSMAAPKGSRLGRGYIDRAKERESAAVDPNSKEERIKALEEQVKLGQLERDVFEKLRDDITGGDIGSTHLVKGLDRQLLERIRRGDDVLTSTPDEPASTENDASKPEEDEELDQLEQRDVAPLQRENGHKKGDMAPPPPPKPVAGAKRSRNDILAELKASRLAAQAAKEAAQPKLDARFRRLGDAKANGKIERDERGREVLITVDEHGRVKRKVRKVEQVLQMPDVAVEPLGIEVPAVPESPIEDEIDDIFEGVGDDYNPLADLGDGDDDSASEEDETPSIPTPLPDTAREDTAESNAADTVLETSVRKNYFGDTDTDTSAHAKHADIHKDPTILAAIKRAAAISQEQEATSDQGRREGTSSAASRLLGQRDRDMDDIDLGFGSSRLEDEADGEDGARVKLSRWKGKVGFGDEESDDEGKKKDAQQRKRGKKKRLGDKNSASDVLKVIEGRKGKN